MARRGAWQLLRSQLRGSCQLHATRTPARRLWPEFIHRLAETEGCGDDSVLDARRQNVRPVADGLRADADGRGCFVTAAENSNRFLFTHGVDESILKARMQAYYRLSAGVKVRLHSVSLYERILAMSTTGAKQMTTADHIAAIQSRLVNGFAGLTVLPEVPHETETCTECDGAGGWDIHPHGKYGVDPTLLDWRDCMACGGSGLVPAGRS